MDRRGEPSAAKAREEEEEEDEEGDELVGGIAAAIAADKAKWAVRIPGSDESASSNACESF